VQILGTASCGVKKRLSYSAKTVQVVINASSPVAKWDFILIE